MTYMGVVHCVYVWVLTDYKYVITSLVAAHKTLPRKQNNSKKEKSIFSLFILLRKEGAFFCECFFMILVPSLLSFWLQ